WGWTFARRLAPIRKRAGAIATCCGIRPRSITRCSVPGSENMSLRSTVYTRPRIRCARHRAPGVKSTPGACPDVQARRVNAAPHVHGQAFERRKRQARPIRPLGICVEISTGQQDLRRTAFIIRSLFPRADDARRPAMRDEACRCNAGPFACVMLVFSFLRLRFLSLRLRLTHAKPAAIFANACTYAAANMNQAAPACAAGSF